MKLHTSSSHSFHFTLGKLGVRGQKRSALKLVIKIIIYQYVICVFDQLGAIMTVERSE